MSGISNTGFEIKRLPEIKLEIENDLRQTFGDINTSPDSVFGQVIGIMSKKYAELWELMGAIYQQGTIYATGKALDDVCALTGIYRRGATYTEVFGALSGDQLTTVPADTLFSKRETGEIFKLKEAVTINKNSVVSCLLEIPAFSDSETYEFTIIVNGTPFDYSGSEPNISLLLQSFQGLISGDFPGGEIYATVEGEALRIDIAERRDTFSISEGAGIDIVELFSPAEFIAENTGSISVPSGTLDTIVTPVSGLQLVKNFIDGVSGAAIESDDELRARRASDLAVIGSGSIDAIRARILQYVANVATVSVFENDTMTEDVEGLPPKSIQVVVSGGDDTKIGQMIFDTKAAGIETFGNITVPVVDSEGGQHFINFQRPEIVFAWVRIAITRNSESAFPENGSSEIAFNVSKKGDESAFNGGDILAQRFYSEIFKTAGIRSAVIEVGTSDNESVQPAIWSEDYIPVSSFQVPDYNSDRVLVTVI